MIEITDRDILEVEKKFGNISFDERSKEFIKCMESKDIQACPGAGKTTSLVAKLDILANSMPFSDNSGVLVLTHTNVAVDEIKAKLGANVAKLLSYPNHVGTFQSFINKYLAIPLYVELERKRPAQIDSDLFEDIFWKKLDYTTKSTLEKKFKKQATRRIEIEENAKSILSSFYIDDDGLLQKFDGKEFYYKHNPPSNTYLSLKEAKKKIFKDGFLTFSDTYHLALKYLKKYPQSIPIFQKRFRYVFIDEAQDTDDKQFEILKLLFENSDVVVQKIGDNNQAIFNFSGQKAKGWEVDENHIEIKDTKRLSVPIAQQASKVALIPQELNGNNKIKIKPTIIIFEDSQIEQVLPKFTELIVSYKLHKTVEKPIFKAIGSVGKKHIDNRHTLPSYYPNFIAKSNFNDDNLLDKIKQFDDEFTLKDYSKIVLDIFLQCLRINSPDTKEYANKSSFIKYLKENNERKYYGLRTKLLEFSTKLYHKQCIKNDIIELFKKIDEQAIIKVIRDYTLDSSKKIQNIYIDEKHNIEVKLSTIHKAKGETHTATLVLSTYKNGYDLHQLLDLLKNNNKNSFDAKKKLVYVAMSRPTHFLCLAISKKYITVSKKTKKETVHEITDKDIDDLKKSGFEIVEL